MWKIDEEIGSENQQITLTFHFSLNRLRILRAKANFLKLKEVFVHVLMIRAPLLVRYRNHVIENFLFPSTFML